jgi:hypothetical protein
MNTIKKVASPEKVDHSPSNKANVKASRKRWLPADLRATLRGLLEQPYSSKELSFYNPIINHGAKAVHRLRNNYGYEIRTIRALGKRYSRYHLTTEDQHKAKLMLKV